MKKYINILFAATVAALTMLSCQPKEEPYEAGPKEADNCYGVYFTPAAATCIIRPRTRAWKLR